MKCFTVPLLVAFTAIVAALAAENAVLIQESSTLRGKQESALPKITSTQEQRLRQSPRLVTPTTSRSDGISLSESQLRKQEASALQKKKQTPTKRQMPEQSHNDRVSSQQIYEDIRRYHQWLDGGPDTSIAPVRSDSNEPPFDFQERLVRVRGYKDQMNRRADAAAAATLASLSSLTLGDEALSQLSKDQKRRRTIAADNERDEIAEEVVLRTIST